jgi:leucyl/phenylalanyl-tRNA---protein transferase
MFSFASDAGKICLSYLFSALEKDGFIIFDTQALNETTWNLGAYEIPKFIYLEKVKEAVKIPFKWEPPQVAEAEEFLLNKFKHSL